MKKRFRRYFIMAGIMVLVLILMGFVLYFLLRDKEEKCNFYDNVNLCDTSCDYDTQCMYIGNDKCINKFQGIEIPDGETPAIVYKACICINDLCEVEE